MECCLHCQIVFIKEECRYYIVISASIPQAMSLFGVPNENNAWFSRLHNSCYKTPTQHDMLPQHLVYKNELNREYVITLARNDETPWWWSEKIETCRSSFMCLMCFKWKLYKCICWLIFEVILRKARSNDEIHTQCACCGERTACLTPILLTWRIWWASNNASRWQMGFTLVFIGLIITGINFSRFAILLFGGRNVG